jgi:hypothetical protein
MLSDCVGRKLIRPYEGSAFRQKYVLSSPQAPSFAVDWVDAYGTQNECIDVLAALDRFATLPARPSL